MFRNENFFPPLPGVADAVQRSLGQAHRHLDVFASALSARIAGDLGVPAGHVVAGAGSAALLQELFRVHTGQGGEVVLGWPSFEAYPVMAANAGASVVRVGLTGHRHDLEAMAAAVTRRTKLVLVCNPNNPTGTVLRQDELREFCRSVPGDVLIVVDEAYWHFADPAVRADAVELSRTDERICAVRTFSKAYGLLGLRVGFAVGHERAVAALWSTLPFFRANTLGQAAAMAALDAEGEMRRRCALIARERDRIRTLLRARGWAIPRSGSNFLWLPLGADSRDFARFCAERGVLVWALAGEGVRVTVGERTMNDAFLELTGEYLDTHAAVTSGRARR